jgi:hypothetical protein
MLCRRPVPQAYQNDMSQDYPHDVPQAYQNDVPRAYHKYNLCPTTIARVNAQVFSPSQHRTCRQPASTTPPGTGPGTGPQLAESRNRVFSLKKTF